MGEKLLEFSVEMFSSSKRVNINSSYSNNNDNNSKPTCNSNNSSNNINRSSSSSNNTSYIFYKALHKGRCRWHS